MMNKLYYPEGKFITKMLYYDNSDEIKISNLVTELQDYKKYFCPLLQEIS